jgi:hypothetical protein
MSPFYCSAYAVSSNMFLADSAKVKPIIQKRCVKIVKESLRICLDYYVAGVSAVIRNPSFLADTNTLDQSIKGVNLRFFPKCTEDLILFP